MSTTRSPVPGFVVFPPLSLARFPNSDSLASLHTRCWATECHRSKRLVFFADFWLTRVIAQTHALRNRNLFPMRL